MMCNNLSCNEFLENPILKKIFTSTLVSTDFILSTNPYFYVQHENIKGTFIYNENVFQEQLAKNTIA